MIASPFVNGYYNREWVINSGLLNKGKVKMTITDLSFHYQRRTPKFSRKISYVNKVQVKELEWEINRMVYELFGLAAMQFT